MNSDIIEEDKVEDDNQDSFVDESICQRHRRLRVAPTQCYSKDKEVGEVIEIAGAIKKG